MILAASVDPEVQVALVSSFGAIVVAVVTAGFELVRRARNTDKKLEVVREHVQNSHSTNLRHDVDRIIATLDRVVENQGRQDREISLLRSELMHERSERMLGDGKHTIIIPQD